MGAFLTGVAAGFGIAIPVGAIAVLIVEVGIKCGFRCAFFAGAGAATADLVYASAAVVGGGALAGLAESADQPLRIISAAVLIALAVYGLRRAGTTRESSETKLPDRRELTRTYARFFGLTIINPATVVYFAAVIVGLGVARDTSAIEGVLFVTGAFAASLSWQTLLAGVGGLAGDRLDRRAQTVAVVLGNLLIFAFAMVIILR
ncbi:MAG: LysE family transporter [Acidimicrobiia bacterium]|nr:LysE family transporter [Acidimicrobiia bacterium]